MNACNSAFSSSEARSISAFTRVSLKASISALLPLVTFSAVMSLIGEISGATVYRIDSVPVKFPVPVTVSTYTPTFVAVLPETL